MALAKRLGRLLTRLSSLALTVGLALAIGKALAAGLASATSFG